MLQAATIHGAQWESVRAMYRSEVTDEVGHAQYLADQIAMLGGTAKLQPDLSPPPTDVSQMLKRDMEEVPAAVEPDALDRCVVESAERAGLETSQPFVFTGGPS